MIEPFCGSLVSQIVHHDGLEPSLSRVISYGVSGHGYDLTLSDREFLIFRHRPGTVVNPKSFNPDNLEPLMLEKDDFGWYFPMPGHSYGLGVARERLRLPPNILGICIGKSTYARCGISVNITPSEAGWEGHLTLEIVNNCPADVRIYANEGITQMVFFDGGDADTCYSARNGKYQMQPERVVFARA